MIKRLELKNITVFPEAELDFSPQLNVFVGENGSGKTHLLKILYAFSENIRNNLILKVDRDFLEGIEDTILATQIRLSILSSLNIRHIDTLSRNNVNLLNLHIVFQYSLNGDIYSAKIDENLEYIQSHERLEFSMRPVYLPTRELLSIYPNFVSVYETTELKFEQTWRDTCVLLGAPLKKDIDQPEMRKLLEPLEKAMGGRLKLENGYFYLETPDIKIEIPMVAEGLRKLGMLAQLIANGSLRKDSVLFWDEPEANLNPKLIRQVAEVLVALANEGIQIFIATHSLFLLRELEILSESEDTPKVKSRYFGLHLTEPRTVEVMQGDTSYDIGSITSLDEELHQSGRFLSLNDYQEEND